MRKIVVVGAAAILSLGVGGTALAASNGFDDSGVSVRPASTSSPSHDVGDDHGGDRPRGVNDDGINHDINDDGVNHDINDDGANHDINDDHDGDRGTGNSGPGSANSGSGHGGNGGHGGHDDGAGHDAGDDHGGH